MLWWTLRQLRSQVEETRLRRLNRLVQKPDVRTLPRLTALVESDPSPDVRAIAVQALAQFGKDAPLQTIRGALNMADGVAVESCNALRKLCDPLAASPLREVLMDSGRGPGVRAAALRALTALQDRDSLVPVLQNTVGYMPEVTVAAQEALKSWPDCTRLPEARGAIPAMLTELVERKDMRFGLSVLSQIDAQWPQSEQARQAVPRLMKETRRNVPHVCANARELLDLIDPGWTARLPVSALSGGARPSSSPTQPKAPKSAPPERRPVAELMREQNCPAAVYFRWRSAADADLVFGKLKAREVWVPQGGVIARLSGGGTLAEYQPHWIVVCGPHEMTALKPFQHWWQYMTAMGLPDHDGWKGDWELDDEEKRLYASKLRVIDHFLTRPSDDESSVPARASPQHSVEALGAQDSAHAEDDAASTSRTGQRTYAESDNLGTRFDTVEKSGEWWALRIGVDKGSYLVYDFPSEGQAREALLGIPIIHAAHPSGRLICTDTYEFGYYKRPEGTYGAEFVGRRMPLELWTTARRAFLAHGGVLRGERSPEKDADVGRVSRGPPEPMAVSFLREEYQSMPSGKKAVYRMHRGSSAASAKAFLLAQPTPPPLTYILVETPEGTFGRDVDGIYQE